MEGIKITRKLQIVHGNVCGPMPVQSFTGKLYFVPFIDDYTRCVKVYFIRKKSKVLAKLKEFEAAATTEAGCSFGTLLTDNGGEYMSHEFEAYLKGKEPSMKLRFLILLTRHYVLTRLLLFSLSFGIVYWSFILLYHCIFIYITSTPLLVR